MAVSENYSELKANENFVKLQDELSATENKISVSRQFYNDTVTKYNTQIQTFPINISANIFNFQMEKLFEVVSNEVRENVKINFNQQ